jgi:dihydrofolate reductase
LAGHRRHGQGIRYGRRFARLLEAKPKHLVSSRPPAPGWNTSLLPRDENGNAIRALQRALGGTLLVMASPTLVRALTEWGLVDEYHLAIQPILAGRGPTFLAGLATPVKVTLKEARLLKSGVALHRYAVSR